MQWIAFYNNGSRLMQYEGTNENKYSDIQRDILVGFGLFTEALLPILGIKLDPSKKLIYRRRTLKHMLPNGVIEDEVIYLVGYQECDKEPVILYYYTHDNHIELDGARNNLDLLPDEIFYLQKIEREEVK